MARKAASSAFKGFSGTERLVVLCGPELFLQAERLKELQAALEKKCGGEVESVRHDGKSAALADVLDDLRSMGLLSSHRLVAVVDADAFVTRCREQLENYARQPSESGTLVLRCEKWSSSWKLHALVEEAGAVVNAEPLSHPEAVQWCQARVREAHRGSITPDAARQLVEHLGSDLARLDSELGKLAVSVGEGKPITPAQVEQMTGRMSEEKAWEIQQALLSGRSGEALQKLRELIDLSGQPDVLVGHFVGDLVRKIAQARAMLENGQGAFEVCRDLKIWPRERQGVFLSAVKKLGASGSAKLLSRWVEIDRRSKSGYGEMDSGLERFCIEFTHALA